MTAINLFLKLPALIFILVLHITAAPCLAAVNLTSLNPDDLNQDNTQLAIQGGLLLGKTESGAKVWLNDKKVRVAKDGSFIIGFGREAKDAELQVESVSGKRHKQLISVQSREYKIQRIDGLPPAKVNPKGEAVLKRIREEAAQVKKARKTDDDRQDFIKGFIWPAKGPISGVYGSQRILNGDPKWPHFGVDIAAPTGAPVIAPAAGVITLAHTDMYYSGGTLIIDHGFGLSSTFLHLSEILVAEGQYVEKGSLVAKVGATGRATGAHLDWRINWFDVRLDAQKLVSGTALEQK